MKFLTRLLIFTSFIFYSCNETSEVGIDELLINQKEKIKVHYVEIPLETSNIYFDSVRTDDGDLYFGRNNDPVFGDLEAIAYSQFIYQEGLDVLIPGESAENYYLPNESSQLDSAVLYLKFSKAYGGSDFDEQEITISQILATQKVFKKKICHSELFLLKIEVRKHWENYFLFLFLQLLDYQQGIFL